jgi:hypothetical protein
MMPPPGFQQRLAVRLDQPHGSHHVGRTHALDLTYRDPRTVIGESRITASPPAFHTWTCGGGCSRGGSRTLAVNPSVRSTVGMVEY